MSSGQSIGAAEGIDAEMPDFEVPSQMLYDSAEAEGVRARIVTVVGGKLVKHAIHYQEAMSDEVTLAVEGVREEVDRINDLSRMYGGNFMVVERFTPVLPYVVAPGTDVRLLSLTQEERKALDLYRDRPMFERMSPLYRDVLLSGTSIFDAVLSGKALTSLLGIVDWQKPFTENGGNVGDKKRAAFEKVVRRTLDLS